MSSKRLLLKRAKVPEVRSMAVGISGWGQTRKIRACPLHVGFTPKPGRFGSPGQLSEKGQNRTDVQFSGMSDKRRFFGDYNLGTLFTADTGEEFS